MASISVDKLKTAVQQLFAEVIGRLNDDKKWLILSPDIIGKISYAIPHKMIREHGCEKIYPLQKRPFDTAVKNILYFVSPKIEYMKWICKQILHLTNKKGDRNVNYNFYLFFVPRQSEICKKELEKQGVSIARDVFVGEFPLDLIGFEEDVISLENRMCYREICTEGNFNSLNQLCRGLVSFQVFYGVIPTITCVGTHSCITGKMLHHLTKQKLVNPKYFTAPSKFDSCLIIDRKIDLISPFLSQLTYEGLIDEFYGISNGSFKPSQKVLDAMVAAEQPQIGRKSQKKRATKKAPSRMYLDARDGVFHRLRALNQKFIAGEIKTITGELNELIEEKEKVKQNFAKLRTFFKEKLHRVHDKKNLEIHLKLVEEVQSRLKKKTFVKTVHAEQAILQGVERESLEFVEKLIYQKKPLTHVLRLMILISQIFGGIAKKKYNAFKQLLFVTYGFRYVGLLNNLKKAEILTVRITKKRKVDNWLNFNKLFTLLDEKTQFTQKDDIHQVFANIAPLSIRLCDALVESWEQMKKRLENMGIETLKLATVDIVPKKEIQTVLLVFVGGITYSEINAVRYLNSKMKMTKRKYIVCATQIINGNTFIKSFDFY